MNSEFRTRKLRPTAPRFSSRIRSPSRGGTSELPTCLAMVKKARDMGLTVPVVLMGYYNPFLQYGIERICKDTKEAGGDGFIVVDLPPKEGVELASS